MKNLSVVISSCLNRPERKVYLDRTIKNLREILGDVEILIGFDKYGQDIDGCNCNIHENGLGYSWNWGIKNASNEWILQIEDDWVIEIGGGNIDNLPTKESFYYHLNNRIKVLNKFNGIFKFTYLDDTHYKSGKTKLDLEGYNFLEFNRPKKYINNTWDIYFYSNQPHLKNKKLHEKIGWYKENAPPHEVELDMCEKYYKSEERTFACPFFTFIHIGDVQSRK